MFKLNNQSHSLYKRELFAVNLRKQKKIALLKIKRLKLLDQMTNLTVIIDPS